MTGVINMFRLFSQTNAFLTRVSFLFFQRNIRTHFGSFKFNVGNFGQQKYITILHATVTTMNTFHWINVWEKIVNKQFVENAVRLATYLTKLLFNPFHIPHVAYPFSETVKFRTLSSLRNVSFDRQINN